MRPHYHPYVVGGLAVLALAALTVAFAFFWSPAGPTLLSHSQPAISPNVVLPSKPQVTLVAVGDIMMSRSVGSAIRKANDFGYPFAHIKEAFVGSDLAFANLEAPISPGRVINSGEMTFRMDPGVETALRDVGFTVVSLANNHTPNWGTQGIKDTIKYLTNVGIVAVGAGENDQAAGAAKYAEANGITFAFLAHNDPSVVPPSYEAAPDRAGTAFTRIDNMTAAVKEAKQQADIVIVSMHAGSEYVQTLSETQTSFARAAIDAGAEMVIGHHPHVVQRVEEYKGKYILYSLGNFIFDQQWSEQTKEGVMVKAVFKKNGVAHISFLPTYIPIIGQPVVATGTAVDHVIQKLAVPLTKESWSEGSDIEGWGMSIKVAQ